MNNIPGRIGNYRTERALGKGGSSQVVLGRHVTLTERQVAIKLLLSQDDESVERFLREASIASRLHHPNIVQLYDQGYQQPYHYAVLEYIEGSSLAAQIASAGKLPIERALHVFRHVAEALDYSHSYNIVHRDVAPGNILLEKSTGRAVLIDFGIAQDAANKSVTTIGSVMGTPGYLSPEHSQSATAVTPLSDIFCLGVVLFEMLTGKRPWDHNPGAGPNQGGGAFTPPMLLRERGVELPADVDRIIRTILATDPAKRYPTALAAYDDLAAVLERHNSATVIVPAPKKQGTLSKAIAASGRKQSPAPRSLMPQDAIERYLGQDLLKAPVLQSRQRAEQLSDPLEIAALLDRWSAGKKLRIRSLGRQAVLRQVTSMNAYTYKLTVLYETRSPPQLIEEPDQNTRELPQEKALDRWNIDLGEPDAFKNEPQKNIRLPGSTRVVICSNCAGLGKTLCPGCEGRGRVMRDAVVAAQPGEQDTYHKPNTEPEKPTPQSTKPTLVPCPDCKGSGGLLCEQCKGVGRMLQQTITVWSRSVAQFDAQDDLPNVDDAWLHRSCAAQDIYREQQRGSLRAEWQQVPQLTDILKQAQARTNGDTRIALSELHISFIPITEVVFDLGDIRQTVDANGQQLASKKNKGKTGKYTWYIYGFENMMPGDWSLLNWDRVAFLIASSLALVLLILLTLALLRLMNMLSLPFF